MDSNLGAGANCVVEPRRILAALLDQLRARLARGTRPASIRYPTFSGSIPISRAPVTSAATRSRETTTTPEEQDRP